MANKNRGGSAAKKRKEVDITNSIIEFAPPTDELTIRPFPWTEKQAHLISTVLNHKSTLTFVEAPAGVGKTICSMFCAISMLKDKLVNKILYVRSPVESCEAKIGFLPSTMEDKMQPYFQAGLDALLSLISKADVDRLRANGTLEVLPPNFAQGRSFHNTFVIIDEASQISLNTLELLCSRFGKRSRMMIIGSLRQTSIKNSGFKETMDAFNTSAAKEKGINCFTFDKSDSMRSPIAEFLADTFDEINLSKRN